MKIALQVGLAWVLGIVMYAAIGWLALLAFAAESAELFLFASVPVVVVYVCLGLAAYDVDWYLRPVWGLVVGAGGIVGTVFVLRLAERWEPEWLAFLTAGSAYAVIAALFARNWWVRGAGALVLAAVLVLAPAQVWDRFFDTWARLG
ncbi:hypothetical protein FKR81_34200 [Lentzea tibetensis]|uniref:Uncharacterized protein n=1 Tax=Lentzea tibetensis TaxID=2591470 RepID=A0A563EJL5_9PSEU|nr:hypothetical protein [Lentzea tibetensis]TWP46863.1 hypothetical protein FKR81_34200 [Lentzea tibetensis]